MSEFNFERDIAPERNTFGFTGTEAAFANAKADQQIMPQLDLMIKLRGQLRQERAADLAYETSIFEFKQRKRTLRDQREADQRAEDLLGQIQMTMEDDQLNPFERQEQLSLIELQNADTFANSKVAQQSLLAAGRFIGSQMQKRREKLSRKIRSEDERKRSADTTGLDANTIFRMEADEQVEDLRQSYLDPDSAGGEKLTARERANLRNAGFAVTKNIAALEAQEKKERESREFQIFNNEVAIAETTLEQVKDLLRQVAVDKKLAEDGTVDFEATYDGLELPNGESLKVPETGDIAAALQKQLQTIRSRTLQGIGQKRRKRNKFLMGKDPTGTTTGTTTGTPTVTPTGNPDLEDILGG
tara:strand:+ start:78 stop:1151 length:1074 start_codon:yes stop_codon:yes gene_type:complete